MGRMTPFNQVRITREIYDRLDTRRNEDYRRDPMTNYINYVLDLWARRLIADATEVDQARKEVQALRVLLEAKQRETAELIVRSTAVDPVKESGKNKRNKAA